MARREEINLRMSRRQGGNTEWGGNEKVSKVLENTIARLELATRNARESICDDDLLKAFGEIKLQPDQNRERNKKRAEI